MSPIELLEKIVFPTPCTLRPGDNMYATHPDTPGVIHYHDDHECDIDYGRVPAINAARRYLSDPDG